MAYSDRRYSTANRFPLPPGLAENAGLPFKTLDESVETTTGRVSIGAMDLAKGNTERHLLYVACTSARDLLLVTGVPSRLGVPGRSAEVARADVARTPLKNSCFHSDPWRLHAKEHSCLPRPDSSGRFGSLPRPTGSAKSAEMSLVLARRGAAD